MLITTVTLKLFRPGNKQADIQRIVAGPGRHFTRANIEKILAEFVEKVEAAMPDRYRLVQVGRAAFNLVRIDSDGMGRGLQDRHHMGLDVASGDDRTVVG